MDQPCRSHFKDDDSYQHALAEYAIYQASMTTNDLLRSLISELRSRPLVYNPYFDKIPGGQISPTVNKNKQKRKK